MACKFHPPEQFDFSQPSGWDDWRERFLSFRIANKLDKEEGQAQVQSLIYAMGREANKIYQKFQFLPRAADAPEEPKNDFDIVLQLFNEYFVPRQNVFHERAKFYTRQQNSGESVEHFIRALYDLAGNC